MKKRILQFNNRFSKLLMQNVLSNKQYQLLLSELIQQIQFFQHERLVHLIVTMTTAVLAIMALGILLLTQNMAALVLLIAFLSLFVPYILHYMLLENEIQKMYSFYDELLNRLGDRPDLPDSYSKEG